MESCVIPEHGEYSRSRDDDAEESGEIEHNVIVENTDSSENSNLNSEEQSRGVKKGRGRPKKVKTGGKGRPKKEYKMVEINNVDTQHEKDPLTVEDALSGPNAKMWREAMESEYKSLMENETWSLTKLPNDRQTIGCKWVFKTKYNEDGSISKYKARLVAKGYAQQEGIDFYETYSPVVRQSSIRLILALAAEHKLFVHQMDVISAYLNGELQEDIYMDQPECFIKKNSEGQVCYLRKSLYGLRQSGKEWYRKLDSRLVSMKFDKCFADECVYIKRQNSDVVIIAVYVDDLIIAASSEVIMKSVKSELSKYFKMKDEGPIHYCLGISIKQEKDGSILLNQKKYVNDVLKRFNMLECKPAFSPLDPNFKLQKGSDSDKSVDRCQYQSLIGSLMYLATSTRPDIAYAVNSLSQYNCDPKQQHLIAAKRVLRYIKGTSNLTLKFAANGNALEGFADADWGGDLNDRKSYTGFVFFLAGGAISWQARKQKSVALSSTEAEYMALSQASREAIYLRNFLRELGYNVEEKIVLYGDNQGAIKLVENNVHHNRTKHIDVQYHFVRDMYEHGIIDIHYMPTEDMVADILTKSLFKNKHNKCLKYFSLT